MGIGVGIGSQPRSGAVHVLVEQAPLESLTASEGCLARQGGWWWRGSVGRVTRTVCEWIMVSGEFLRL